MLKLIDLIESSRVHLGKYKIHFATNPEHPPIEAFLRGEFQKWQEWQNNRNFDCDEIVSLIGLDGDTWLFVGIYQVLGR